MHSDTKVKNLVDEMLLALLSVQIVILPFPKVCSEIKYDNPLMCVTRVELQFEK